MDKSKYLPKINFNCEEVFLMERAIDLASGMSAQTIHEADARIKSIMSRKEKLGKKKFEELLDDGIRDWDECMTYFHVQRSISDRLKRVRWINKGLVVKERICTCVTSQGESSGGAGLSFDEADK